MSFLDTLAALVGDVHPDQTLQNPWGNSFGSQSQQAPPTVDPNGITVNGNRPAAPAPEEDVAPNYGNADQIREADASNKNASDAANHKGRFGVGGTLRDILGTLGDAFLVQSGNKSVYDVARQGEKVSDALTGFSTNPMAAMERLSRVDPEAARSLYNDYQKNMYNYGMLQSLDANRASEIRNRDFDNQDKGLTRVQQWAYGGMPYERIVAGAARYGLGPDDLQQLGISPNMTDEDRKQFAAGANSVNNQMMYPLRERQTASGEKNAEAHYIRATRPPQGRQPRAQTDLEHYQQINQQGYQKTPADQAWENKYLHGTKGSNGRRSLSAPASSGWGTVTKQ